MSEKTRIHNTEIDNLISNLRGEVGEIVSTWVMMRNFMTQANGLRGADPHENLNNPELTILDALTDKLSDEIIARLAELADRKVGQLTFHFAHLKLGQLQTETEAFTRFIESNRFREKRNYDISHKQLPEKWADHKYIYIRYPVVLRGIAMALGLMKKIDALHLGPRAKYLWKEMRRRRYKLTNPAGVGYMLLPHFWLSGEDRMAIIREELAEGRSVWKDMPIKINGRDTTIKACGELGAIIMGRQVVLFDELTAIDYLTEGGHQL